MSRFINCATRSSGSDWICPIMGNSCIFHWETSVCFGDGLGNRCNLRRLYAYLLFHWYAAHVWDQWERKTNISKESTCKNSLFPQTASLDSSQKLHKQGWAHTCTQICMPTHSHTWAYTYIFHYTVMSSACLVPRMLSCWSYNPLFFAVRVTEHWRRLPREALQSPCLEILKSHLDMVLRNQL